MRIGIDLGGTKIEAIALDGSVERGRVRVESPQGDYEATLGAIVGLVRTLEEPLDARATVGIGIPGTISSTTGLVKNANSVWLIGRPLQSDLEQRLDQARLDGDRLVGADARPLVAGLSPGDRLRLADRLSHPYFWAGMTLSGSPW